MKQKKNIFRFTVLILAIVVLLNIISDRFFLRLDLTADRRYTLSTATKDILRQIDEPVTVTAYFSKDLPPDIGRARRDFMEMLVEYRNHSRGNVLYEFIDPNKDEQSEEKAIGQGIRPVIINTREKDQAVQKKAYLGAVIQKGERSEVIPFVQPGAAMEYDLSAGIKKLTLTSRPVIGFLQGHGEPSLQALRQVRNSLEVMYEPRPFTCSDTLSDPDFNTLVIIAPRDSFSREELDWLDDFVARGNNLVLALDRVDGDMMTAMGKEITTGLETWLEKFGIRLENNFLIDANCAPVTVTQQQGMYTISRNVQFPYIPVFSNFADHPATSGLEAVLMQFPSTISFPGNPEWISTPIVFSSSRSGTRPPTTYFDLMQRWTENDFSQERLVAGATLENAYRGGSGPRMVVFSDGDFPVNGTGEQARQIQPDNSNLLVNAIDWLSDDTGLISLRTKTVTARMLQQLDDGKKTMLKFLNFSLPILLTILFGIYRIRHNRIIRIKRMEENYV